MNIVHVTRSLIVNSGISVFVSQMANAMAKAGQEVHLRYTWKPEISVNDNVNSQKFTSLNELTFKPDIVHVHGVWSMDMVRAMNWCRKNHVKYFVSPHGGLMPRVFRCGRIKKYVFYWLFLRKNLNAATGIHCTGDGEKEAVCELGIKSRTFIVPLGCDIPKLHLDEKKENVILFLSRIGEEKGLLYLLDGWKVIDHNGWRLVLAGPDWEGFRSVLERKIRREGICDVEFFGPANEAQKDMLYRKSRVFALPSPMENFSMAVLDALAYGLPVICTIGTPWKVIMDKGCGWWVNSNDYRALSNALKESINLSAEEIQNIQVKGLQIASEFTWQKQARKMIACYQASR
jgi:glycosyltransferase involved in cell wall biosynthesis